MAVYTMELADVLELDPTIESGILQEYPIFDEAHRATLNRKILNHFHNREIGQETISMFRLALKRKLDEIMPLYNQQYEISAIKFDQLETVRINNTNTTNGTTASTSASNNESNSGAKSRAVASQFPQVALKENADYATSAQDNISDTTATATATDTNTVNQDGTSNNATTGFQGNAALMILQYRQSLVNVDMMIIDELQNLFMLVWANNDEYANNPMFGYFGYGRYGF
jgi:hypothetical protein